MSGERVKGKRGGGGNPAQRFQKPNRKETPQTHMQDNKKAGFYSFRFGLFPPHCAAGALIPPGLSHRQMRSRNALGVLRGRGLRMLCIK